MRRWWLLGGLLVVLAAGGVIAWRALPRVMEARVIERGAALAAARRYDGAIEGYTAYLRRWRSPRVLLDRGRAYWAAGRRSEALADFTAITQGWPQWASGWSERGGAYYQMGQFEAALQDFEAVLRLDPRHAYSLWGRGMIRREQMGDLKGAYQDFTAAIAAAPNWYKPYANRGGILTVWKRYAEAQRDLTAARRLGPDDYYVALVQGYLYESQDRLDQALAEYERAVKLAPTNPSVYISRGRMRFKTGDAAGARTDARTALKLNPQVMDAYDIAAGSYYEQGKYDAALREVTTEIERQPQRALLYAQRAKVQLALKHYEAALADTDKALALDPKVPDARYIRGLALRQLDRPEAAVRELALHLKQSPDDVNGYWARSALYTRSLHDYPAALADADRVIELQPKKSVGYRLRGDVFVKLQRWDEALREYNRAVTADPTDPGAYVSRAWLYMTRKSLAAARGDFEEAIRLAPDTEPAKRARKYLDEMEREAHKAGQPPPVPSQAPEQPPGD